MKSSEHTQEARELAAEFNLLVSNWLSLNENRTDVGSFSM